jgi:hypothetical protein
MKKIFRNFILLSLAFAFILTASCKKYPDGPLLSLRTKEHRLAGTWDVEYFSINGFDSTGYLKNQPFYGVYAFSVKHNSDVCSYSSSNYVYSVFGFWKLVDNNNNLIIKFNIDSTNIGQIGAYRAEKTVWEIRRLTEKELWLKTTYTDGREYFVKFKQA